MPAVPSVSLPSTCRRRGTQEGSRGGGLTSSAAPFLRPATGASLRALQFLPVLAHWREDIHHGGSVRPGDSVVRHVRWDGVRVTGAQLTLFVADPHHDAACDHEAELLVVMVMRR